MSPRDQHRDAPIGRPEGMEREISAPLFVLGGVEERIRVAVRDMDIVEYVPALAERFVAWAEASLELAHGHAFNAESMTGQRILAALEERGEERRQASVRQAAALECCAEAARSLTSVPVGLTRRRLHGAAVVFIIVNTLVASGIAGLLTPALDVFVLRAYLLSFASGQAGLWWSAQVSLALAVVLALALTFGGALVALWTKGRIGALGKVTLIVGDLSFSVGFAVVRMSEAGLSMQSIAWSVFEGALLAVCLGVFGIMNRRLAVMAAERREWRAANARVERAKQDLDEATAAFDAAVRAEAAQAEVVQAREECEVELQRKRALARETALLAYLTELFALRAAAEGRNS